MCTVERGSLDCPPLAVGLELLELPGPIDEARKKRLLRTTRRELE